VIAPPPAPQVNVNWAQRTGRSSLPLSGPPTTIVRPGARAPSSPTCPPYPCPAPVDETPGSRCGRGGLRHSACRTAADDPRHCRQARPGDASSTASSPAFARAFCGQVRVTMSDRTWSSRRARRHPLRGASKRKRTSSFRRRRRTVLPTGQPLLAVAEASRGRRCSLLETAARRLAARPRRRATARR
jgi:hypothetical protein